MAAATGKASSPGAKRGREAAAAVGTSDATYGDRLRNYINGAFVDPVEGGWLDNFCPATGKVYSHCAASTAADVANAVAAAKAAFPAWAALPAERRAKFLNAIADGIEARLGEFAAAESDDQGKTVAGATTMDIPRAVANFRFFAGRILHHEDMSVLTDGPPVRAFHYSRRHPMGVAALVSPWNLPLYLATWKVAPAIAVGNTCVLKPSELSPRTATLLGEVCTAVGLPPGVVNIVHGTGPAAGQALIEHPTHIEAKRQQARWINGYHIVIGQVLQSHGDGGIRHPLNPQSQAAREQPPP